MVFENLCKEYNIGIFKSKKALSSGRHNNNYLVNTSKGKYVFRISQYKSLGDVDFQIKLLINAKKLKVPRIIKGKKGYLSTLNKHYVMVYPYIKGKSLTVFSVKQLKEVGKFIAEFQNTTKKFKYKNKHHKFYYLPDSKIKSYVNFSRKKKIPYLNLLPTITKELKRNRLPSYLPQGPIHVDIKPENVLFYKGNLSGVIDFDNAYIGHSILDVAKSMVWFASKEGKFNIKKAKAVFEGYSKRRKLTKEEKKNMYKAVKFAFLSHTFVDYYMYAKKATKLKYFKFIVKEFHKCYNDFKLSESDFNNIFLRGIAR